MTVELPQVKANLSSPCAGIVLERDYWKDAAHQLTRHIIYLNSRGACVHPRSSCERKAVGSSVNRSNDDGVGVQVRFRYIEAG